MLFSPSIVSQTAPGRSGLAPEVLPTPVPTKLPDVWHERATGLTWCDCGEGHPLTKRTIASYAADVCGQHDPERITHAQVIAIAQEVWSYRSVCRFFTMSVEDAAKRLNGSVAEDYPREVGLAIVKAFSNRWNGCPEEGCQNHRPDSDIDSPPRRLFSGPEWGMLFKKANR